MKLDELLGEFVDRDQELNVVVVDSNDTEYEITDCMFDGERMVLKING